MPVNAQAVRALPWKRAARRVKSRSRQNWELVLSRLLDDALGEAPARFVETPRLDHARALLRTSMALKSVAAQTGYATADPLSKVFARRFGLGPGLFRTMHTEQAT